MPDACDVSDATSLPEAVDAASPAAVRAVTYGARVCLTAHNGRYISAVSGGRVEARRARQGEFGAVPPSGDEIFVLESAKGPAENGQPLRRGDAVRLRAPSVSDEACYIAKHGGEVVGGVPSRVAGEAGEGDEDPRVRLRGAGDGVVDASVWTLIPGDEAPPTRIGLDVPLLRARASRVRWFGRGPHESYPDRCSGARLGVWDGSVASQAHPYVRPQETGGKHQSRWMALSDEAGGKGILVATRSGLPLHMACHHYDADDLDTLPESRVSRVRHAAGLIERDVTALSIDGAHAGVGGIDSWGSMPMPHHRLTVEQPREWAFALKPFGDDEDVAALAAATRAEI